MYERHRVLERVIVYISRNKLSDELIFAQEWKE
jgi:hypothetical protein